MENERNGSGGTSVVLFGPWFVLVVMISLTVQPYARDHPYLAWSMVIVGIGVFIVGIIFMLGGIKRKGRAPNLA